jgi:hypothetical protein
VVTRRSGSPVINPSSRVPVRRSSDGVQAGAAVPRTGSVLTDRRAAAPVAGERRAVVRPRGGESIVSGRTASRVPTIDRGTRVAVVARPRRSVYVAPVHRIYRNYYYYYPRDIYPYGYGAFGLGYFYYDPYVWAPVATIHYDGYAYGYGYGDPTGELRLQVRPRDAEVYVDGYYAGMVDDFDGTFQSLRLEEGEYHIEIVAPGYETIAFDVQIQPGRKINYRGDLFVEQP